MIIFYKKTGEVYAVIEGRAHDQRDLNSYVEEEGGKKLIIGWVDGVKYNEHLFPLLTKFEDLTPASPLDYKVKDGKLIKK